MSKEIQQEILRTRFIELVASLKIKKCEFRAYGNFAHINFNLRTKSS